MLRWEIIHDKVGFVIRYNNPKFLYDNRSSSSNNRNLLVNPVVSDLYELDDVLNKECDEMGDSMKCSNYGINGWNELHTKCLWKCLLRIDKWYYMLETPRT